MKLSTYLHFDGNCEEALNFYEQALGAKIIMKMRFSDAPMAAEMPQESHDKIMHARIVIGSDVVMASDAPCNFTGQAGFAINISVDSIEEAERLFTALSEGAKITMPIEETFWADRFGMLTDRFGVAWMLNCEKNS